MTEPYTDEDDLANVSCAADAVVDAERDAFWAAIHKMSSGTYKPTRRSGVFLVHESASQFARFSKESCGYLDRQGR